VNKYLKIGLIGAIVVGILVLIGNMGDETNKKNSIAEDAIVSSEDVMPVTANNVQKYLELSNEAASNSELGVMSEVDKMKVLAREPLESMGYNFDTTLLMTIKNSSMDPALIALMSNAFVFVINTIEKYPDESVEKGLVHKDTKNKILLSKKYWFLSNEEQLKNFINIVESTRECQSINSDMCNGNFLKEVLIKKGGLNQYSKDTLDDERFMTTAINSLVMPMIHAKMLENEEGIKVDNIVRIDQEFKITDETYNALQSNLKNIWWIK